MRGEEGQGSDRELRNTSIFFEINKLQGHTVQHREHSHYVIITMNGIQPLNIVNNYAVHLKLI